MLKDGLREGDMGQQHEDDHIQKSSSNFKSAFELNRNKNINIGKYY